MNNIRSKTPRPSNNGIGTAAKRKAPSSPNQMCDLFKKVKSEKATSGNGGSTTPSGSKNNILKKQPINTCNIKTSTPTESPAKTQPSPQIRKNETNQPNLKLLICRVCRNNYDSKHLPVLISDCMETCCNICAQNFLSSSSSTRFKCNLCGRDHKIPESKTFQTNKFVIDFLNIKLPRIESERQNVYTTDANNNNISNSKSKYKEVEAKLNKLIAKYNEFNEDMSDKASKSKLKLAEYCEYFIDSIKDKHKLYEKDFNSDLIRLQTKFNEQKQKLINDLNALKQSNSKTKESDTRDLMVKLNNLESFLWDQIILVKQSTNLKSEQEFFLTYMIDNLGAKQPRLVELNFENESFVNKKTIHAINYNKVFYCTLDKKNQKLIACVCEFKLNNKILEKFELEASSKLKYITTHENNLLTYFDLDDECKIIKYDTKFNKPKCLSSNREVIFMSNQEIMLFSNKSNSKLIKVLDQDLNTLESFGQNISEKQSFFIKNRPFKIIAASRDKIILKYELDKYLRIFSRPHGNLLTEIKLNDSSFDENDLNNVKIKFIDENVFHIIMISKQKMKFKMLNNSGICLREFNLNGVRDQFDRFSITNDDLIAFYYENDNLIQFIQL